MALSIGDNFNYAGAKPLDNRRVVASKAALDAVALSTVYEGMIAYAKLEDKYYRLKDGAWIEFSAGSVSLPVATTSTLGGIIVGDGLEIKADGTLSATSSPDNSVVAWTAGDSYAVGQYVVYDNNMYECITANSDSTFDADKWQLIGESSSEIKITDWKSGTSYSVGDLVLYNYTLYQCTTANSDTTFDETNWTAIGNVDEGISEWVSGQSYSAGNIVIYDSKIYKCTTANSDTTFDAGNWDELGDSGNVQAWVSGTAYAEGDFAIYNNRLYQCLVANSDTTFDEANWVDLGVIQKTVEAWTSGKSYSVGDIVIYGNAIYKCTTANSDATFIPSNWSVEIDNDKSVTAWVSGTSYTAGKYVVYDSRIWECTVANSDTTFTEAHWQEISPATGIVLEAWATSKSYKVNQFVEHNTHAYMCLASHTSGVFATDFDNGNWRQVSFDEFAGATATTDGEMGIVPQPKKADYKKFLCGDGTWKSISRGSNVINIGTTTLWSGFIKTAGTIDLTDSVENYDKIIVKLKWDDDTSYTNDYMLEPILDKGMSFCFVEPGGSAITSSTLAFSYEITFSVDTCTVKCYTPSKSKSWAPGICEIEGIKFYNPNGYSTEEQEIGTWIDGKPLYQKTFAGRMPSTANKNSDFCAVDLTNYTVISLDGYVKLSNGMWVSLLDPNRTSTWASDNGTSVRCLAKNSEVCNMSGYVTIKYTKTTD